VGSAAQQQHPAEAWTPQEGPQYVFATTSAEIAVIGGSPGGGKSVSLLYEGAKLTQLAHVRAMRATAFRRTEVALLKGGSLWDRATMMLPAFGGRVLRDDKSVVFEASSGRIEDQHRIDFQHLHSVDSVREYDGSEQDLVIFDELQDFEESQFWYLVSRMRSTTGLRPRMRASCNAEPDSWLAKLLDGGGWIGEDGYIRPERSGVVRWFVRSELTDELEWFDSELEARAANPELGPEEVMSFTFVLARTSDNRRLSKHDPGYRGRMRNLLRRDRLRLFGESGEDRGGNWLNQDVAGDFFALDAIRFVDAPPSRIVRTARGWDFGSSEPTSKEPNPDWTEGARVSWCEGGEIYIEDVASAQLGPIATTRFVERVAERDGPLVEQAIFQDAGAAGKRDAETTAALLEELRLSARIVSSARRSNETDPEPARRSSKKRERSSPAKQALAKPWALLAEQGRVYARRAEWNAKLRRQTHPFPNGKKDDLIDAISCAVQVLEVGTVSTVDAIGQRARLEADALAKAKAAADAKDAAWREEQARERPVIDVEAWAREHGRRT
jgi:phage terminase large subunit-like protein